MVVVLSVLAMLSVGVGELFASGATDRARSHEVTAMMFLTGTVGTAIVALFWPGEPVARDLGVAVVAGVVNGIGILLTYAAYSRGSLRSAAPSAAVVMTAIPVAWDFVLAEQRPSAVVVLGIVLGLVAIGLTSYEGPNTAELDGPKGAVVIAVGGGLMFGLLFILLGEISSDAGGTPVVIQRGVALVVAVVAARATGPRIIPEQSRDRWIAGGVGLLATATVVLIVIALQLGGSLSVVSVLTSQYAAVAVVAGVLFANQTITRVQGTGLALASVAVALITLG